MLEEMLLQEGIKHHVTLGQRHVLTSLTTGKVLSKVGNVIKTRRAVAVRKDPYQLSSLPPVYFLEIRHIPLFSEFPPLLCFCQ